MHNTFFNTTAIAVKNNNNNNNNFLLREDVIFFPLFLFTIFIFTAKEKSVIQTMLLHYGIGPQSCC